MSNKVPLIERVAVFGGVLAVIFEWSGVAWFYMANKGNIDPSKPLSHYATLSNTRWVFALCYTLAAVSFWLFVKYNLNKHFVTPVKMFAGSMLAFAALAIIPFDPTNVISDWVHKGLAITFGTTFIVGVYFMYKNNTDAKLKKNSLIVLIPVGVLYCFTLVFQQTHTMLLLEFIVGVTCQYWTLWMTLHAYRKQAEIERG